MRVEHGMTDNCGTGGSRATTFDPGLFARRLEELFRTVPGPNGRAYSAKAIANRSTELGFRLGRVVLEPTAVR